MTAPNATRAGSATTLVAIIGLVATVVAALGSSFIAGRIENEGTVRQFEQQRSAELDDLRRDAYAKFLQSAEVAYRSNKPSEQEVQAYEQGLKAAEATVLLLATPSVRDATRAVSRTLLEQQNYTDDDYLGVRNAFIEAAQEELDVPSR